MKPMIEIPDETRCLLAGLGRNYHIVIFVDLQTEEFTLIKSPELIAGVARAHGWRAAADAITKELILPRHQSMFKRFVNLGAVKANLQYRDFTAEVMLETTYDENPWRKLQWFVAKRDETGAATHAFYVTTVVEEEERKKLKLQNEMTDIVNVTLLGIWRIDFNAYQLPRLEASPMMRELIGLDPKAEYAPEEMYDFWYSHIAPESLDQIAKSYKKMIAGYKFEGTYHYLHPTKGDIYLRGSGIGYHHLGEGTSIVGYVCDVTEEVLEEREQQMVVRALAETYEALCYIDVKTQYYTSYCNKLAGSDDVPRSGYLLDTASKYKQFLSLPEYEKAIQRFMDMSTIDERMKFTDKISTQFQDLDSKWYELSLYASERNSDNKIVKAIMGVKDIDKKKKQDIAQVKKLKESIQDSKSKTDMLQNMTHELRAPLNAMFGFAQLLSMPEGSISDAERAAYFNYIYNSFNMLTMHIDDVLDMTDAQHGNYNVVIGDVHVNDVCRHSLQMVEPCAHDGVHLYFTTDVEDDCVIQSDERRIQQVLVNYLTNACKHTNQGEVRLHVSNTETPGRLTFSVTDTGEGIPADQRKDIFNRYKKANGNSVQGSGLGLNICSLIAEKLNGEVKLDESYTTGARFLFVL